MANIDDRIDELTAKGHSEFEAAEHLIRQGVNPDDAYAAAAEALGRRSPRRPPSWTPPAPS